jgi:hypothetical protein
MLMKLSPGTYLKSYIKIILNDNFEILHNVSQIQTNEASWLIFESILTTFEASILVQGIWEQYQKLPKA